MNVIKCDVCNRETEKHVRVGVNFIQCMEVCYGYGKPVVDFLKKHKFIKDEKTKK